MSTELVRRDAKPRGKPVVPRQLLAKRRLTPVEWAWVWWKPMVSGAAILSVVGSILAMSVDVIPALASVVVVTCVVAVGAVLSFDWTLYDGQDKRIEPRRRREMILADRGRLASRHAPERTARAADVRYAQFSVTVRRSGGELIVGIVRHEDGIGRRVWRNHSSAAAGMYDARTGEWGEGELPPPPPKRRYREDRSQWQEYQYVWNSVTGTHDGSWVDIPDPDPEPPNARPWMISDGKQVRINAPSLERVSLVVEEIEERAAALERNAYQEALAKARMERLALLFEAPPSGAKERALVHGEELEDELSAILGRG